VITVERSLRIAIFDQKSPQVAQGSRPMSIADPKRTFELPEPDPHSLVGFRLNSLRPCCQPPTFLGSWRFP
jgi:hypothetical protein